MAEWYIYAIGASIAYTGMNIVRKKALSKSHSMSYESLRTLSAALFGFLFIPFIDWGISAKYLILVYAVSLIGAIGIIFASKAFHHNDISLISPLNNLRPAFVAIIAFFFLSETLGIKEIIGIFILLAAAYILEADHHFSSLIEPFKHLLSSKYSLFYIFAVFLFSVCSIFHKFVFTNLSDNIFTYYFLLWIFTSININIIHAVKFGIKDSFTCLKKVKFYPVANASLSTAGNLLELKAITLAMVSLVQPIIMLSTLFIVLVGGKFFHEENVTFRLIVSSLMLVGAYLIIV